MTGGVAGASALVCLATGMRLAGVLADGDRRSLTVVLPLAPGARYAGEPAVVEYATALGVHRVHGRLATDAARREVLHLARDGGEVLQRREWVRVDAVRPVRLAVGGDVALVHTRNLSAGGMLVQDPLTLATGEEVAVALQLVDGEPAILGRGPVTDAREDERLVAIRLDAIAAADRERIIRWAAERQRHELRTVRRS